MEFTHVGDLEQARRRLGDTGHLRRELADVLDESARLGQVLAREEAPTRSRALQGAIEYDDTDRTAAGALEATVGVHRTLRAGLTLGPEGNEELYPLFVHEGTGLFGASHRLIRPVRAPVMRWFDRFGSMSRKTTRGQRANPYIERAFEQLVHEYIPQRLDLMVQRIFGR